MLQVQRFGHVALYSIKSQLISITVQQMCLTFQYPMCDRTHSWKLSQVLAIKWQCTLACAASHQYQHAVLVLGSMKIKVVRSSFSSCRKWNQTRVQSVLIKDTQVNVELNVRTVNSRLAVLQDDCKSRIKKNQWAFCIGKIQTGAGFCTFFFSQGCILFKEFSDYCIRMGLKDPGREPIHGLDLRSGWNLLYQKLNQLN